MRGATTVMVALLRGVNVGGASKVAMADVRAVTESCGFRHVRSYVQSGNLIFAAQAPATPRSVEQRLAQALAEQTSVAPAVLVRTHAELQAVVAANPFADRGAGPTQLHVVFLAQRLTAAAMSLDADEFTPEEFSIAGREIYLHLPGGAGRSKLAVALTKGLTRAGGGDRAASGTMRNWRTVTTLLEMAEATPKY
ncbi:MAG: DUF1697 domain-containing protein [Sporichthyaceae bacterium]